MESIVEPHSPVCLCVDDVHVQIERNTEVQWQIYTQQQQQQKTESHQNKKDKKSKTVRVEKRDDNSKKIWNIFIQFSRTWQDSTRISNAILCTNYGAKLER